MGPVPASEFISLLAYPGVAFLSIRLFSALEGRTLGFDFQTVLRFRPEGVCATCKPNVSPEPAIKLCIFELP